MQFSGILKTLAAASATIVLLSGCATAPSPEAAKEFINKYEVNHSFAHNASRKLMISWPYDPPEYIQDKYIDDDEYEKTFKTKIAEGGKPSAMTTGQLAVVSGTLAAIGGTSTLPFSGLFFLTTPIAPQYYMANSFGFVLKKDAQTPQEAKQKYFDNLVGAVRKVLTDEGYENIQVQHAENVPRLSFDKEDTEYVTVISGVSKKDSTQANIKIKHFRKLKFAIDKSIPAWISANEEPAWKISPNFALGGSIAKDGKFDPVKTANVLVATAKYLPDYAYLLVPPYPYAMDGEKMKWGVPYLADNKNRYYFFMPKSMRWK